MMPENVLLLGTGDFAHRGHELSRTWIHDFMCQFMKRVRHWYPTHEVWIALDQDRSHPCKSRQTRQMMRTLKLHWISLQFPLASRKIVQSTDTPLVLETAPTNTWHRDASCSQFRSGAQRCGGRIRGHVAALALSLHVAQLLQLPLLVRTCPRLPPTV